MKRLVLAGFALALLSGAASAQQAIGGRYGVAGLNLDGSRYTGTAEIRLTSDTTCAIRWSSGGGASVQNGICMRSGPVFVAAYVFGNGQPGLVIYRQQPDGSLEGTWTVAGQTGVGREVLSPAR